MGRRVVISGSSGLVGAALARSLLAAGDVPVALVRPGGRATLGERAAWDPSGKQVDLAALEGADAIVHLAGENIASGRWTEARKRAIRESRVAGTSTLADAILRAERPPKVLVSASAVGYYGDRGAEELREDSGPGTGFLSEVCQAWEAAARPAEARCRVVVLRIGMVLAKQGGVLARLVPPFRAGLGGPVGPGTQWASWIRLHDLLAVIERAIEDPAFNGAYNCTAPAPVTNRELTKALGQALRRPTILPAPSFALRLVLGEMADELLLASTRAIPARLTALGFPFQAPTLDQALALELG
jgi:hypothetical protein